MWIYLHIGLCYDSESKFFEQTGELLPAKFIKLLQYVTIHEQAIVRKGHFLDDLIVTLISILLALTRGPRMKNIRPFLVRLLQISGYLQ